ncbi:hypothetical protein NOCD_22270, partial [Nocardioides cavernae]
MYKRQVSVREALLAHPDPDAVLRYSDLAPYDTAEGELHPVQELSLIHISEPTRLCLKKKMKYKYHFCYRRKTNRDRHRS